MSAILLTPPASEPVSLAGAKLFLRVEHDADDDLIAALIAAARVQLEAQTRRALITQTWRLTRDVWPAGGVLPILPVPLREVSAIGVYDSAGMLQMLDVDDFPIDTVSAPAMLAFERGAMPVPGRPNGGIEIDIEVGYGDDATDVPEPFRQAIRLLVAHWYENRRLVAASGEVASLPASVASLIAPFRVLSLWNESGKSDPGMLNRRLILEAPVESADGAGGVTRSFETVATLWVSVTPVSASRQIEAARLGARVTHRLLLRFSNDITTRHRFRDGERIYRIVTLRDRDGRKRFLDIEAEERID